MKTPSGFDDEGSLWSWNGPKSRADQIEARFKKFAVANVIIWTLFQKYAFEVIRAGFPNYCVSAIIERIRWHTHVETRTDEPVKISNDFRAYYARLFVVKYPQHGEFFRLRHRRSQDSPPFGKEPGVDFSPPTGEGPLMDNLRDLLRRLEAE